jgi:pantetheine-phosphate adenylyltransferase
MRIALFPGSFDPITLGHENVVRRAVPMFDQIVVAVGRHSSKKGMFSVERRVAMIQATFADCPSVRIESYDGLTADFCKEVGAQFQLRGVRNAVDLSYEQTLAQMTRAMHPDLDTVVLLTDREFAPIHSTVVRDVLSHGGDVSSFVPAAVLPFLPPRS